MTLDKQRFFAHLLGASVTILGMLLRHRVQIKRRGAKKQRVKEDKTPDHLRKEMTDKAKGQKSAT